MPKLDTEFCQRAASPPPKTGPDGKPKACNRIHYDGDHKNAVPGFGLRVTSAGAKSFILNYRTRSGRERRYTIGDYPAWKAAAAREEAATLRRRIKDGFDPLADLEAEREAPTVADMCQRYEEEHLPKKRPSSQEDDKRAIQQKILPELKHRKVAEVAFADVDALHRKITKSGHAHRANRVVALLSKMFNLATLWGWRADNPAKGIERNPETKRHRYLTGKELTALTAALAAHEDKQAANIFRLLLLTGARRGEVLAMRWADLDLEAGTWTKPGATTKQKTLHHVPLSAPARQLLVEIKAAADAAAAERERKGEPGRRSPYVFPSRYDPAQPRENVKGAWADLCKSAGLLATKTVEDGKGDERTIVVHSARIHDLRHSYASILASAGLSLPVIGALLGHTNPNTTQRYAHLLDDPLKAATERVAAIVEGRAPARRIGMKRRPR